MNRTYLVAVTVIIALAGVILWTVQRRTTKPAPERGASSTPDAVAAAARAAAPPESSKDAANPPAMATVERTQTPWWWGRLADAFVPRAAEPDGIAVEVVDDETGAPMPDALVFVLFEAGPWGLRDSSLEKLASSAPAFRTDARGSTSIRLSCPSVLLVAVKADRWGAAPCRCDDASPVRIRLHANSDVALRVVGEDGAPRAGIPVRFGFKTSNQKIDFLWLEPLLHATTDSDGIVTFTGTSRFPDVSPPGEWGASPEIALAERVFWKIDRAAILRDPIECKLPGVGAICVRVVDAKGRELPINGTGVLFFPTAKSKPEPVQNITYRLGSSERVAIGLGLKVGTQSWLDGYGEHRGEREGPSVDGEEATLDLVLDDPSAVDVTGVATWSDGSPAAGELELAAIYPTGNPGQTQRSRQRAVANPEGTFHGKFARLLSNHGVVRLSLSGKRGEGHGAYSDYIDVDLVRAADPMDLGHVALAHEESLLVSGLVVDAASRPLPHLRVMGYVEGGSAIDRPWSTTPMSFATTDDSGRFRIVAIEPHGKGRLTVVDRVDGWMVTADARFEAGDSDVRLVAMARGAIHGRVLLSPEIQSSDLSVALSYSQDAPPVPWNAVSKIAADGSFAFDDVDPGVVQIGVCRTGANATAPLAGVEGVTTGSLQITRDPRLDPIDLRGRLHVVAIDVGVDAGTPAPKGVLYAVDESSGKGILEQFPLSGTPVRLLLADPADVVILADGFRTERLRGVDGDRAVRLHGSAPCHVTLHLHGLPERRKDEEIVVLIGSEEVPLPEEGWRAAGVDVNGDASLALDEPGSYRIEVKRDQRGMARQFGSSIAISPRTFTVVEGESDLSFDFQVAN